MKAHSLRGEKLLYPLNIFDARNGIVGPAVKEISAEAIPPTLQGLLVGSSEMTAALEAHFEGPLAIRLLSRHFTRSYFRRVLLVLEKTGLPVGMAAIRVRLDLLPDAIVAQIRAEQVPLGRIMREVGIGRYTTRPEAFAEVEPNGELSGFFWKSSSRKMYGRRATMLLDGAKFGEVAEILADFGTSRTPF